MTTTTDKAAPTEEAPTIDEQTAELEAILIEVAVGIAGLAGSGVVARSPHARAVAYAYQQRSREGEAA